MTHKKIFKAIIERLPIQQPNQRVSFKSIQQTEHILKNINNVLKAFTSNFVSLFANDQKTPKPHEVADTHDERLSGGELNQIEIFTAVDII